MKIASLAKGLLEKATGIEDLERSLFIQTVQALEKVSPQKAAELAVRRFSRPRRRAEPEGELALASKGTLIEFRCSLVGHKFGSGKPVVLIHGWGGRGLQLGTLVGPLVHLGYSVIALDGPAHGRSPGDWTSPTHFANFIKTVSMELGPLHAIVAHSFGAGSTVLALDNGVEAEKAVLVAPTNRYGDILKNYCEILGLGTEATHLFHQLVSYRVGIPSRDFFLEKFFARLKQPVLIVHDKNDKEISYVESQELAKSNARAGLIITEGQGHRRILKSEVLVQKVTEFLR